MQPETRVESDPVDVVEAELANRRDLNLERLRQMVRIPSVSASGFAREPVRRSARQVAQLATEVGLRNVELIEISGSHPHVYGEWLREDELPTVLLYAHHDVQPPGPADGWTTDPFDPAIRNGRLYGRGAADDKGGIGLHLAAVEAWLRATKELPVNVKILIDGEEEIGNPTLRDLLQRQGDRLEADVVVIADSMNWRVGEPSITYSLRGVVSVVVELRALERPVHSGIWGGVVPDPVMGLCKVLSTLSDQNGTVAVDGFDEGPVLGGNLGDMPARPPFDLEEMRRLVRLRPGVQMSGYPESDPLDRMWWLSSVTVIAVDAPGVEGSSNTIQAAARAKISLRLAPGQDPERAEAALLAHLRQRVPWGLEATFTVASRQRPWFQPPTGPVFDAAERTFARAFGTPIQYVGMGGTVPLVGWLSEALGGAIALLTGVEDPESQAHGPDESLHIEDWHRACRAEALLLGELARGVRA